LVHDPRPQSVDVVLAHGGTPFQIAVQARKGALPLVSGNGSCRSRGDVAPAPDAGGGRISPAGPTERSS